MLVRLRVLKSKKRTWYLKRLSLRRSSRVQENTTLIKLARWRHSSILLLHLFSILVNNDTFWSSLN